MWSAVTAAADGSAPASRAKHSATLLGAHVYLLGGRNGNLPLKDLWRYSLAEGRWTQLSPRGECPPCLQEHTAVAHRDSLYVFGGELGFSGGTETPLWVYHVKTNTWRKVRAAKGQAAPRGRRGHTALVQRDHMLVYGGYRDLRGSSPELWAFHFDSETWSLLSPGESPPARHKHSAVLHDDAMWVYGGMTDLNERADLWRWDTVSHAWSLVRAKPGPGPLHSHAACRLPSSMLLFGGERDGHPTSDLWRFHFGTETWERLTVLSGPKPQPRAESVALAVSDLLLLPPSDGHHNHTQHTTQQQQAAPVTAATAAMVHHQRGGSVDRSVRHNRVAPSEARKYAFRPTTVSYAAADTSAGGAGSFLREISKLSQINLSRLSHHKCSYSVLSHEDSTESLLLSSASSSATDDRRTAMVKSQSANVIARKSEPASNGYSDSPEKDDCQDTAMETICGDYLTTDYDEGRSCITSSWGNGGNGGYSMTRDPVSVPNFGALTAIPTPALTPVEVTKLVFIDPEDEFDADCVSPKEPATIVKHVKPVPPTVATPTGDFPRLHRQFQPQTPDTSATPTAVDGATRFGGVCGPIPKSASVRFNTGPNGGTTDDDTGALLSTSDYASLETVNRSSYSVYTNRPSPAEGHHPCCPQQGDSPPSEYPRPASAKTGKAKTPVHDGPFGFCNPNYLGPDIQTILAQRKSWHDGTGNGSGTSYARLLNSPHDSLLEEASTSPCCPAATATATATATTTSAASSSGFEALEMRSLSPPPALAATEKRRLQAPRASSASRAQQQTSGFCTPEPHVPLSVFVLGGKEQGQVTVFKRPMSVWRLHLTPDIF
ncbi:uncharacterized protein LOC126354200 isoform X2 [Schistocerca gregaria]|nr:uncharacterized protein LOC126354200 isoform X2 [Schistocerca gregaria]